MKYEAIDMEDVDGELERFFRSIEGRRFDQRMHKYKKRFFNERDEVEAFESRRNAERLSLGKKLEILCTYAGFRLIKEEKFIDLPKKSSTKCRRR